MHRTISFLLCFLLVGFSLTGLSGCWGSKEKKKTRIIILTNGSAPFWDTCRKGAQDTADEVKLKDAGFTFEFHRGKFTPKEQISRLERYLSDGDVAGLAISVTTADNKVLADLLKKLQEAGTNVITLDSDVTSKLSDSRLAYIGTNNKVAGKELGKATQALRPEGGEYVPFVGLKSAANAVERVSGFAEGAGDKFKGHDVQADAGGAEDKEKVCQRNVQTVLNSTDEFKNVKTLVGIWAYNGPIAAAEVAAKEDAKGYLVVTFDADPRSIQQMDKGNIKAMMVQNPYQMGEFAVRTLKALAEAEKGADPLKTIKAALPKDKQSSMKGDVVTTGLRIVVPAGSPIKKETYEGQDLVEYFTLDEFKKWLKANGLEGS